MITGRLWTVTRRAAGLHLHENRKSRAGHLHTAACIILESGLIYAATTATQLGAAISRNMALYPITSCVSFSLVTPNSRLVCEHSRSHIGTDCIHHCHLLSSHYCSRKLAPE
jgi:hypothetical protein